MTDLERALIHLTEQIQKYRTLNPQDGNGMVECLQQITPTLFYLEGERAKYHDKFQTTMHMEILKGRSVSGSENEAHIKVPEMYRLRKIIDSAYETSKAIGINLSWLKNEMNNSR